MRRAARLAVVCLLVLAVASTTLSNRAASAETAVQITSVTSTSPTSLQVTWAAPTDANRWWVTVDAGADDRSVGQRTACGSCRSIAIGHLAPASSYFVRVLAIGADGSIQTVSPWVAGSTPRDSLCGSVAAGRVCVAINALSNVAPATGVGLGVLHSITSTTAPAGVTAVQPKAWRVSAGDMQSFNLAKQYGGSITVLLSDPWTVNTGALAPWSSWDFYSWWVGAVVDAYISVGQLPDYWEVQNEPTTDAYTGAEAPTAALVFQQFQVASAAIHARLPNASVIGPSAGYVTFGSGLGDIDAFLANASAANVQPGAISWHEIGASCLGYCDGSPRAVLQHADDVRAAIAANPGAGTPDLIVNEWGAPWNEHQPGAVVGYLSSLAYAGVKVAGSTCWPAWTGASSIDNCFASPGTLDGFLMPDGATPTDAWFVERAYAQMTGAGQRLLSTTIGDPEASVVATAATSGVVKVLLGRHTGCQTGVDESCPGLAYAAAKTIEPVLSASLGARYKVTVERISSTAGSSTGSTVVFTRTMAASFGRLDLGAITVADGSALLVTLQPV